MERKKLIIKIIFKLNTKPILLFFKRITGLILIYIIFIFIVSAY